MIRVLFKTPNANKMSKKIKESLVDSSTLNELDNKILPEIKRFMSSGVSPVKGKRRFVEYKDKRIYPGKRKASRPVNLKLSGDLYAALVVAKKTATSFYIGVSTLASRKLKIYAKANNLGVAKKNIAERRFVPIQGEQFNVSIMRQIRNILAERIAKILKK